MPSMKNSLDVNAKDGLKHTPIHLAAAFRSDKGIEFLIKKGANLTVVDNCNQTPLHVACMPSDYTVWADPFNNLHRFFTPAMNKQKRLSAFLLKMVPKRLDAR